MAWEGEKLRAQVAATLPEGRGEELLTWAREQEYALYLVGGVWRSLTWGESVHDWDLVVDSSDPQVACQLSQEIAQRWNLAWVVLDGQRGFYRCQERSQRWSLDLCARVGESMLWDLQARDFTINALAWEMGSGQWLDGGYSRLDLEKRHLRLQSPKSLEIDPLRALRAARFAASSSLSWDRELGEAVRATLASGLVNVAPERQWAELAAWAAHPLAPQWSTWEEWGLLHFLDPQGDKGAEGRFKIRVWEEAQRAGWPSFPQSGASLKGWLAEESAGGRRRLALWKLWELAPRAWAPSPPWPLASEERRAGEEGRKLLELAYQLWAERAPWGDWYLWGRSARSLPALLAALWVHKVALALAREGAGSRPWRANNLERGVGKSGPSLEAHLDRLLGDYFQGGPIFRPQLPVDGLKIAHWAGLETGPRLGRLLERLRRAGAGRFLTRLEARRLVESWLASPSGEGQSAE